MKLLSAALATLATALAAIPALAQDCEFAPRHLLGGAGLAVTLGEHHAYVTTRSGLQVLELEAAGDPSQVAHLAFRGLRELRLGDGVLFATEAVPEPGLVVIDVSTPMAPVILARAPLGPSDDDYPPLGFDASGARAVVAHGAYGADVFDIADPAQPTRVATLLPTPDAFIGGVCIIGDHVLLIDSLLNQAYVYRIAPTIDDAPISTLPLGGGYIEAAITIGSAVAVLARPEVRFIDLADPTNPAMVATIEASADAHDLAAAGDHLVVAGTIEPRVIVIDASDAANPAVVSSIGATYPVRSSTRVASNSDRAVWIDLYHTDVINLVDPTNPNIEASSDRTGLVQSVASDGGRILFTSPGYASLAQIDGTGSITLGSRMYAPSLFSNSPRAVSINGDKAVVANWTTPHANPLQLLSLSGPNGPEVVDTGAIQGGYPDRIQIHNGMIFVTVDPEPAGPRRLSLFDLATPGLPLITTLPGVEDYTLWGETLYCVDNTGRVTARRLDALPELPLLGQSAPAFSTGDPRTRSMTIRDGRLYLVSAAGRIATIDVADPGAMVVLGDGQALAHPQTGYLFDIVVEEQVAYVVCRDDPWWNVFLWAIDTSIASQPRLLARRALPPLGWNSIVRTATGVLIGSGDLLHFDFVTCPCPADLNGDGFVGMADLMLVVDAFNTTPADPNYNPAADTNLDKVIDFADLNVILASFNQPC